MLRGLGCVSSSEIQDVWELIPFPGAVLADNKRQHFVPKYVLRYFSADASAKRINLFHIPSKKFIRGASLREQCYQDYFYGDDIEFEKNLSVIEGGQADLLRHLIQSKEVSGRKLAEIPLFLAMQYGRTLRSAEDQNDRFEAMAKLCLSGSVDEGALRSVRIRIKDSSIISIANAIEASRLLYDLQQVIIENKTNTPFVISDHPVVITNWFCRRRFPQNHGTGLAAAGLQIFMPISPKFSLMLLDAGTYRIADKYGYLPLTKGKDIHGLNALQWINADKVIYVPQDLDENQVKSLIMTTGRKDRRFDFTRADKLADGSGFVVTDKDEYATPTEGVKSELVVIGGARPEKDIRFSGLGLKSRPQFYDDGSMVSPLRDPYWLQIVEDFIRNDTSIERPHSDFAAFVASHPLKPYIGHRLRQYRNSK